MNSRPKVVFLGNTKYSVIGAKIINQAFPLSLVVTIPDRIVGRKKISTPSPTKVFAKASQIPVLETEKLTSEIIKKISEYKPDFLIVEDYGLILPTKLLNLPKKAPINIHHSLLPKYRGPSPAPSAILSGDKISGVTVIKMSEKVDAGDILGQREYQLTENETTDSLLSILNELGAKLAIDVINNYMDDAINPVHQNESEATFSKFIKKRDGFFDILHPPTPNQLDRMIRAYFPWPNAWTIWNGKVVKFYPDQMVQMEGKNIVSMKEFLNGYPNFPLKTIL
jgi:methionyl-tRNA formyltransferase